ncbi:RNA exonuclease ASCRUDRAFT_79656 [Ascoidea rubescens DSM 1968]|uniref:Endonuclease/exonuclease/phosphatase domain-containing protein n=1 Tax=Ascoidea rubescens DSM 1968 TaxID=1344418 RepID=A0A1D2VNA7_9ASCO|nr:hypothetical protein ASCRUDRAFT_79656 [Ascoidea rubescens DSM 1968]ODV63086.1 hypothetical protein ASCRUDRAFT_79656 [Ascoidea rubescens DSM 1968]
MSFDQQESTLEAESSGSDVNNTALGELKGKKGKKSKKGKQQLTPEIIAEKKRQRELKKQEQINEMIKNGRDTSDINVPPDLRFKKRPFLPVHNSSDECGVSVESKNLGNGFKIKIMTYNILAQCLIRRKLFPTNGSALKWVKRSKVLLSEFQYYNADVLCLQEVDHIQFESFWKTEFEKLGYKSEFYRYGMKNHGVAIVYRVEYFTKIDLSYIVYDEINTLNIKARTFTSNIGLMIALEFTKNVLHSFSGTAKKKGIIIGTTHLFWHPFGTYERTRQTYIVLSQMKGFLHRVAVINVKNQSNPKELVDPIEVKKEKSYWFSFFAGDFNSQPYDTPYLFITEKPVLCKKDSKARNIISCATSFEYSSKRGSGESESKEENVEYSGENQPKDTDPEFFEATEEQNKLVDDMLSLHNSLPVRAISLYSVAYKNVHPENSGIDNNKNEPFFSNWAHSWRGLLDYIFLIKDWDLNSNKQNVDTLKDFENENEMKIVNLLRMPEFSEMGKEPSGQPREGQYPSDHLCMIAEVELKIFE